jgi:DNA-binding response OmpR family regulator
MRLLLAEDDAPIAEFLVELLTEEGFQVRHVTTPQAAMQVAASEPWDVCLVESFTISTEPDPGDVAFMRTLAAHAPVVVLTGEPWASTVRPNDLGVRAVVRMPFDIDGLMSALRRN